MPSMIKLKNSAIAERSAALPKIPQELLDQIAQGATTAEAIQDVTMALKKALIERALGGELSHHLGYPPGGDKPVQAGNHRNGSSGTTGNANQNSLFLSNTAGKFNCLFIADLLDFIYHR